MVKIHQIRLDARFNSTLSWHHVREEALKAIGAGYQIIWSLEMGIFHELQKPLSNSAQFLNLGFALEHFYKTVWSEFHRFSIGVSLYEGPLDFSLDWNWSSEHLHNLQNWLKDHFKSIKELSFELQETLENFDEITNATLNKTVQGQLLLKLFLRDVASEYLEQLSHRLPQEVTPYLFLTDIPASFLEYMLLTHPGVWKRMKFYSRQTLKKWETDSSKPKGVCLPSSSMVCPSLLLSFSKILVDNTFKWIPEEELTMAWNELDELFYSPKATSAQGHRMLQGFQAAGGQLVQI